MRLLSTGPVAACAAIAAAARVCACGEPRVRIASISSSDGGSAVGEVGARDLEGANPGACEPRFVPEGLLAEPLELPELGGPVVGYGHAQLQVYHDVVPALRHVHHLPRPLQDLHGPRT